MYFDLLVLFTLFVVVLAFVEDHLPSASIVYISVCQRWETLSVNYQMIVICLGTLVSSTQ